MCRFLKFRPFPFAWCGLWWVVASPFRGVPSFAGNKSRARVNDFQPQTEAAGNYPTEHQARASLANTDGALHGETVEGGAHGPTPPLQSCGSGTGPTPQIWQIFIAFSWR